jgi:peptidoglycan hydrolase CwlO-like protein
VALLSQAANAAPSAEPKPSLEEVEKKVNDLYHQAETATEKYNATREKAAKQRQRVDTLLDDVAKRTDKLNTAREELGSFAAAQYRTGAAAPDTATLLLADNPQDYFDQTQLMSRLTTRQKAAVDDYVTEQAATTKKRAEAAKSLETLTSSQNALKTSKADVQHKLTEARELLSKLTAEEKARLAAIEKKKQEEAARKAAELARQQAAAESGPAGVLVEHHDRLIEHHDRLVDLDHHRLLVRDEGGEGPRVRPRADRQAVRLGGDRPGLVRLLGFHPGCLEGRRRLPAARHLRPGECRHDRLPVRRPAR